MFYGALKFYTHKYHTNKSNAKMRCFSLNLHLFSNFEKKTFTIHLLLRGKKISSLPNC